MRPGVAAGHPATAEAGAEILADGGTAADAVVAMCLASCVAETVMSGLLAGCHAIAFDGSRVSNLDGFAAVPSGEGELVEVPVAFGDEVVVYSLGPASCAVPGLPAALGDLWERLGRLPWRRLVEPALALARLGVPLPAMHEKLAGDARPRLHPGAREELFVRDGRTLRAGGPRPARPGDHARDARRGGARGAPYRGSLAEALVAVPGVVLTWDDLRDYEARWRDPAGVEFHGYRIATRGGLSGVPELLPRVPRLAGLSERERVLHLVSALETAASGSEHTTNMVAVDGHGRACALTHSLGVGAGVWVPGLDVQLNNLLGESDIAFGEPGPGDRLESRMAPTLAFDDEGLVLALGAAGATRLRTALATVLAAILDEGLEAEAAVARPRVHPTPEVVDAEPGVGRGRARRARGSRPCRQALGALPPLLRRRQLRRPGGSGRRPAPERSGDRALTRGRGLASRRFECGLNLLDDAQDVLIGEVVPSLERRLSCARRQLPPERLVLLVRLAPGRGHDPQRDAAERQRAERRLRRSASTQSTCSGFLQARRPGNSSPSSGFGPGTSSRTTPAPAWGSGRRRRRRHSLRPTSPRAGTGSRGGPRRRADGGRRGRRRAFAGLGRWVARARPDPVVRTGRRPRPLRQQANHGAYSEMPESSVPASRMIVGDPCHSSAGRRRSAPILCSRPSRCNEGREPASGGYLRSSRSMRRDATNIPTTPIASR